MIRVLLICLLLAAPLTAQVRFHPIDKKVIMERLQAAPKKNEDRQQMLGKMFAEVGCEPALQPIKFGKSANVICILKGTSEGEIIVGGHVDHVSSGDGIIDDWSGASLLPSLYESLKTNSLKHTIIFIGFAEEETGLNGSAFYVKQMSPAEKAHAKAMVNLECLGLTKTKVWLSHSDKTLASLLAAVSQAMQLGVQAVNVEEVGSADSESFAKAKIPRITLHTITQETLRLIHTKNDNMQAIHEDDYYENYRLIAAYLAAMDALLDPPENQGTSQGAGK